jgi:hypothetical protein
MGPINFGDAYPMTMMKHTLLLAALFCWATGGRTQSLQDLMNAAGQNSRVTIEEDKTPYKPLGFTGSYRWEVNTFNNGKPDKDNPTVMRMAFDDSHMAMLPETRNGREEVRLVFDLKNKHTYTLTTDEKGKRTGIKMKTMRINLNDAGTSTERDDTKVVRTNETRTIEGHVCRKYTYSDEEGHGEAWIAEDVQFNAFEAMGHMVGGAQGDGWQKAPYQGMVMESIWNNKSGKKRVEVRTKDLVIGKVDPSLFSTAGYDVQDLSGLPLFGQ